MLQDQGSAPEPAPSPRLRQSVASAAAGPVL